MFPNYKKPCNLSKIDLNIFCREHCLKLIDLKKNCLKYEKEKEVNAVYSPEQFFMFYKHFVNNILELTEYEVRILF